jgi:hypothetical protein
MPRLHMPVLQLEYGRYRAVNGAMGGPHRRGTHRSYTNKERTLSAAIPQQTARI